jgi:outer membrane usher protein
MPGTYTVDLHVNGDWVGRMPVRFVAGADKNNAMPCIDDTLLKRIAFNYEALESEAKEELVKVKAGGTCLDLNRIAEGAKTTFDQAELRLDISVPQAIMARNPRGYVSPELWTNGIPAATVGYNFNTYRTSGDLVSTTQSYVGLNVGAHAGGWHLRHTGSMSWQPGLGRKYQATQTYVQHDIPDWQSQLTIGDSYTEGQLFEGVGIRGIQLSSDDRMLPDSRRGYAPVIRGVAQTNAKVTVTQNGNKVHEITVPPGAFEINDLYAAGSSGDLVVTVTEADGRKITTVVPYSTVIQLMRPGTSRYSLAIGKIREGLKLRDATLVRGTYQRGFSNALTGYAGLTAATGYTSALVGVGFDTRFGAMAADLTHAKADLGAGKESTGQSLRLTYSKIVPETNTSFSLAAYKTPPRSEDRSSFERLSVSCLPPDQRLVDNSGERLSSAKPALAQ